MFHPFFKSCLTALSIGLVSASAAIAQAPQVQLPQGGTLLAKPPLKLNRSLFQDPLKLRIDTRAFDCDRLCSNHPAPRLKQFELLVKSSHPLESVALDEHSNLPAKELRWQPLTRSKIADANRHDSFPHVYRIALTSRRSGDFDGTVHVRHKRRTPLQHPCVPNSVRTQQELDRLQACQANLTHAFAQQQARIRVKKKFILAIMGDSFAAGQGEKQNGEWHNRQCNRSLGSPARRAFNIIKGRTAFKDVPIQVIDVSCAGATIYAGLLGPYWGAEPVVGDRMLRPQIEQIKARLNGQRPDVLLMGIGGNDAGFVNIIFNGAMQEAVNCFSKKKTCNPAAAFRFSTENAAQLHASVADGNWNRIYPIPADNSVLKDLPLVHNSNDLVGLNGLPAAFDDLAAAIARELKPHRTLITEYPSMAKRRQNQYCLQADFEADEALSTIPSGYFSWVEQNVQLPLNQTIANAARKHNWTLVDGIFESTEGRGLCYKAGSRRDDTRWFNTLKDHLNKTGTAVHPNRLGNIAIGDKIKNPLSDALRGR